MAEKRGYRTVTLELGKKKKTKKLKLYTSQRIVNAAKELTENMDLYHFPRLTQVLEAVHAHGKKEGAREVFDGLEKVKRAIPHALPGRPRLRAK